MEYSQEQLQGFLTQVRTIFEDVKIIDISVLITDFEGDVSDLTDLLELITGELNNIEDIISTQTEYSIALENAINEEVTAANNAAAS